jgi:hypothetical protein
MKFLNSLKKEIKNKWSTRLLVGVFALILCSSFASTLLLKREYDKQKKEVNPAHIPLKGFNQALNQSFKHIKIEKCFHTNVLFETRKEYAVYIDKKNIADPKWSKRIYILNDTLFIKNIDEDEDAFNNNDKEKKQEEKIPVQIYAPEFESITVATGSFQINSLNQKSLIANLSKTSSLSIENMSQDLDVLKISMTGNSTLNLYRDNKGLNIKNIDATLTENCALLLGNTFVENLKVNGDSQARIQLSTEMLHHLMKK